MNLPTEFSRRLYAEQLKRQVREIKHFNRALRANPEWMVRKGNTTGARQ